VLYTRDIRGGGMTGLEALKILREAKDYARIKRKDWDSEECLKRFPGQKKISTSEQYDINHHLNNDLYRSEEVVEICLSDFLCDDWEIVE
jgi:hypothetical protein